MRPAPRSRLASLHVLGVGTGRVMGLVGALAISAAGCAALLGAPAITAAAFAITAALAVLFTVHSFAVVLAREVDSPLRRAASQLLELQSDNSVGRLPELGAPQVLALLRTINATSEAIVQRGRSCANDRRASGAAHDGARQLLQQLPFAVLELDAQGRILSANDRAYSWLQLPRETVGHHHRELLGGSFGEAFENAIAAAFAHRAVTVHRESLRVGDRHLDLHVAPRSVAASGSCTAVCVDVTRHLATTHQHDQLIASLSGEVRTRLQHVCSTAEVLAHMPHDRAGEWREFASTLLAEARRLRTLVDDKARTEQVRSGRCEWQMACHDPANLTADAIRLAEQRLDDCGMHFELRIEGSAVVSCDGPRMTDVLVRLLHAACDQGQRGEAVQVCVQDLGERAEIAIAQDRPGLRFDGRRSAQPEFAIDLCRGTVEAMGGSMHHEDSPYGGRQFRIVLPQRLPVPP
jgi:signal transduction histidine kinase